MTCDNAYDSNGHPINDAEYFAVIRGAMKVLNFTEKEQWNIWTIVALVMHLGNVVFGGEEGRIQCSFSLSPISVSILPLTHSY